MRPRVFIGVSAKTPPARLDVNARYPSGAGGSPRTARSIVPLPRIHPFRAVILRMRTREIEVYASYKIIAKDRWEN